MKTVDEIIEETVEYYKHNPRATVNDSGITRCLYFRAYDSAVCAVGRCMKDPQRYASLDGDVEDLLVEYGLDSLDPLLKEEYRGHSLSFWLDLQDLHDNDRYWKRKDVLKETATHISWIHGEK